MVPKLTFLNHASFLIESSDSFLLVDPWLEGFAFDKGWALLDKTTSNFRLIDFFRASNKPLSIWYSHEHSDHFTPSFLKALKAACIPATIYFQKTLDKRVATSVHKLGFEVLQSESKLEKIDAQLSLVIWPFGAGDSFCLIKAGDFSILNLNDCVVKNAAVAEIIKQKILSFTGSIDLLFTQFGYANWTGNESDVKTRENASREKIETLAFLTKFFSPKCLAPFASFISFCHEDNFYMNKEQNTPRKIFQSNLSLDVKEIMLFMKPGDQLELVRDLSAVKYQHENMAAIEHWERYFESAVIETRRDGPVDLSELKKMFTLFRKKILWSFLGMPVLLELVGIIKPIRLYLDDLNLLVALSYLKGMRGLPKEQPGSHTRISSETLAFCLKFEYGANTTHVNGKFRQSDKRSYINFFRFFSPAEYLKNGWGLKHPIISTKAFTTKIYYLLMNNTNNL